jgi:hypothetical protein
MLFLILVLTIDGAVKKETIRRFWVVTQKSDNRKFATVNAWEVELCLKHPKVVSVAEVTMTEMLTDKINKMDLTAIDMTAIEWSKPTIF